MADTDRSRVYFRLERDVTAMTGAVDVHWLLLTTGDERGIPPDHSWMTVSALSTLVVF